MLEQLSQRARFRQWLQDVASGKARDYPEPSDLPRDARIVLESDDTLRRELRQMRDQGAAFRRQLAEAAGLDPALPDSELFEQLGARLRSAPRFTRAVPEVDSSKTQSADAALAAQLDDARTRIRTLEAELDQARRNLEAEQKKMGPVVRYAYRLRRMVQSIYVQGELTGKHKRLIEELLRAGGVPVDRDRKEVTHN
jgi:hypothetical protein